MLTQNKILDGKLVHAWKEPAYRELRDKDNNVSHDETRVSLVIDETDAVLGAVTDRYTLVRNRDYVSALDVAASELGVALEPTKAQYCNGRGLYQFKAPDFVMQAPGDPSKTTGLVILTNDYRGNGGLGIKSGMFRVVCTNGMVVGKIAHQDLLRHVGEIDIYAFVREGLQRLVDQFDVNRLLVSTLATHPYNGLQRDILAIEDRAAAQRMVDAAVDAKHTPDLIPAILADTPDRYHQYIKQVVGEETQVMGANLWALAQLVARTATHRMPETATADDWATRQLNRVREYANV